MESSKPVSVALATWRSETRLRFPPLTVQLTLTDDALSLWLRVHLQEDQTLNPDVRRNQALVVIPKNGAFLEPAHVNNARTHATASPSPTSPLLINTSSHLAQIWGGGELPQRMFTL